MFWEWQNVHSQNIVIWNDHVLWRCILKTWSCVNWPCFKNACEGTFRFQRQLSEDQRPCWSFKPEISLPEDPSSCKTRQRMKRQSKHRKINALSLLVLIRLTLQTTPKLPKSLDSHRIRQTALLWTNSRRRQSSKSIELRASSILSITDTPLRYQIRWTFVGDSGIHFQHTNQFNRKG